MTHWSKATGIGLVVTTYLIQASMIIWGPPPVKAFGIAWAATPGQDPIWYGIGYWAGSGIGHGDDLERIDVFTGLISEFDADECDPFHPDWAQRCLGVPSPF